MNWCFHPGMCVFLNSVQLHGNEMRRDSYQLQRMLVRDTDGLAGEHSTENKEAYIFIVKEKVGSGVDQLPHFGVDV